MKVEEPFFSVVIATYNRANFLERALDSLVNQSISDWEAIIMDDGSIDRTASTIASYFERHKNLLYYKKKHSGVALTKNAGIQLAKGKYVTFLDSDDTYEPNHLEIRQQYLLKNTTIDFLYGGLKVLGNQYVPNRFNPSEKIHLSNCVAGGTFFIKRELLKKLKGFRNISIGEDADLLDRAKATKYKIVKVDDPTYIYHREHNSSITKNSLKSHNIYEIK